LKSNGILIRRGEERDEEAVDQEEKKEGKTNQSYRKGGSIVD